MSIALVSLGTKRRHRLINDMYIHLFMSAVIYVNVLIAAYGFAF
ncbi:hypothetical protein HMPREF6485_1335 [Segatella buccae ATCC 33574]|uniref:Uncharacterized protein n=1 Tax=Segatella buccae ATCC 33574 TaxID=873513 RepID=E6K6T6_9BACT|nr:hypothetical protein HMPREF6485_1335 [Segatella buccae ATCC 33574]